MREILFRGKLESNQWKKNKCHLSGKWVYGHYTKKEVGEFICGKFQKRFISVMILNFSDGGIQYCEVISETIGQYTGLPDKNGTKIFEGDIAKNDAGILYEVLFNIQKGYVLRKINTEWLNISNENDYIPLYQIADFIEVIGNIHNKGVYNED